MTIRPRHASDEGRQMAQRLVALLTSTDSRTTADKRPRTTEANPAADRTPDPAAVTWTRAQLRRRIQRAGTELAPTAEAPGRQAREADPSPYADREPEP
jgi:hypothetical protein